MRGRGWAPQGGGEFSSSCASLRICTDASQDARRSGSDGWAGMVKGHRGGLALSAGRPAWTAMSPKVMSGEEDHGTRDEQGNKALLVRQALGYPLPKGGGFFWPVQSRSGTCGRRLRLKFRGHLAANRALCCHDSRVGNPGRRVSIGAWTEPHPGLGYAARPAACRPNSRRSTI